MVVDVEDGTIYRYILEAPKFACVYYSGSWMAVLLYQMGA